MPPNSSCEEGPKTAVTGRENFARAIAFRGPAYLPSTLRINLGWLYQRDPAQLAHQRTLRPLS